MLLLLTLTSHIFVQQPTEKGHYIHFNNNRYSMILLKATFIYLFIYLFIYFQPLECVHPITRFLITSLFFTELLCSSTFEYYSPNTSRNRKQASPSLFKTPTRYFLSREMIGDPPNS